MGEKRCLLICLFLKHMHSIIFSMLGEKKKRGGVSYKLFGSKPYLSAFQPYSSCEGSCSTALELFPTCCSCTEVASLQKAVSDLSSATMSTKGFHHQSGCMLQFSFASYSLPRLSLVCTQTWGRPGRCTYCSICNPFFIQNVTGC